MQGSPKIGVYKSIFANKIEVLSCGKNLIDITATSKTENGLTFVVNADKTVTVSGTATARTLFNLIPNLDTLKIIGDEYYISGCPNGGSTSSFFLNVTRSVVSSGTYYDDITESGNGASVHLGNRVLYISAIYI